MKYKDSNKAHRELQRRVLHRAGWRAVTALKDNGSEQWKWIHKDRKRAYSREEAFKMAANDLRKQGIKV